MDKTEPKEENIVKKTCKELGFTYKELGEKIGYSESAIKKSIANNNISEPMNKAISLYLDVKTLEKKLSDFEALKSIMKKVIM
ncbi:MAG: transcriptional regulator [Campylobacterota bacterium]|nr:transcriptional regulator [Campylobacterota bacterium]